MRNLLVLILAVVGASVDALSYLGIGQVFTANMTGNLVLLGLSAAEQNLAAAARAMGALAAFALGVGLVTLLERWVGTHGKPWPRAVTIALGAELALLVAAAVLWLSVGDVHGATAAHGLVVLFSAAMGMQSAAVGWLGVRGVVTTYVTGTITSLVSDLILHKQGSGRRLRLVMLGLYALGALVGGLLYVGLGPLAAFLPVIAVAVVTGVALWAPWAGAPPTAPRPEH